MGAFSKIIAVVYIIVGLYLVNIKFNLIPIDFLGTAGNWIVLIGGIIVLIHGFAFLLKRARKSFEHI